MVVKTVRDIRFTIDGKHVLVFGASFSQIMHEAAVITVSLGVPEGGLIIAGNAQLYVIYEDDTQELIGQGRVSGFPVGISGDIISIDFICRNADNFDQNIDDAYASLPQIWQPDPEVISTGIERRAEGMIPFFVYTDPITHSVSFKDIRGSMHAGGDMHVLKGETPNSTGESFVFSITPSMRDEPIKEMVVESVAEWQQVAARVIDFGTAAIGALSTATPAEYVASVDNMSIQGGSGYVFTGSTVRPRFNSTTSYPVAVRKSYIDKRTSILHPVIYENLTLNNYLAPDVNILSVITQDRKERARMIMTMDHGTFGGRRIVEEYQLEQPEERFKTRYSYPITGGARGNARIDTYPDSVHYNDMSGSRQLWIPRSLINRAYTKIVDASFCVSLRIETTAGVALSMKVGELCRVEDVRLPAGYAEGRVSLVSAVIEENATGVIEIECSTCSASASSPLPNTITPSVLSPAQARPTTTQQESELVSRNPFFFLEGDTEHTDGRWDPYPDAEERGLTSQYEIVAEINATNAMGIPPVINPGTTPTPEVYDIRGRVLEFIPATSLAIKLRDVGQVDDMPEHVVEMNTIAVSVKKGLV